MSLHVLPELDQRSSEWYAQRRGMVTASAVGKLISVGAPDAVTVRCSECGAEAGSPCLAKGRKEPTPIKTIHAPRSADAAGLPPVYGPATGDEADGLIKLLVAERISGNTDPTFTSRDMERGIWDEPLAREVYAEHYAPVEEVGFMVRDDWGFSIGYSPDGLVGEDGLIEIKSRRQKTHLATVLDGEIPAANMAQIQCGLLVSGRSWCDYISYCGGMHLWRRRVLPDPRWQAAIVAAVKRFEGIAADMIARYSEATTGLPMTERIDHSDLGLVF